MKLTDLPKPFFVLAPMYDVTDTVFRQIIAACAPPDLYVTEFVNVDGLQSPGREKLLPSLRYTNKEKPIIAQFWGKTPENYYQCAREAAEMGFDGIDINMGCPDKSVIKNGCCIALINNRELASEIIQAAREGAGTSLPLSVKTRLGLREVDYSWHEFLLKQKLNMLSIHGRTAKQMSKVPADWQAIARVRELRDKLSPTTLIVGNGDVMTRDQGLRLAQQHRLDGIMMGRAVFHDPYAFAPTTGGKSPWETMDRAQRIALYRRHVELFARTWAQGQRATHTLNKFCKIYIQGFDGAKEMRETLMAAKTPQELLALLQEFSGIVQAATD